MAGSHRTTALYTDDFEAPDREPTTNLPADDWLPEVEPGTWFLDAVGPDGEHQGIKMSPESSAGVGRDPVADPPVDATLTVDDETVSKAHLRVRISRDGHAFVAPWEKRPTNRLYMNGCELQGERQVPEKGALLKAGLTYLVLSRRRGVVNGLVCFSRAMREVVHQAMKCASAPKRLPVLIVGETGTGKTELARVLHEAGRAGTEKFVERVLSELPRDLVSKAIFGARENAATNSAAQAGAIATAGSGTLFLDEIGDLPLDDQTRLLRPLRARKYQRIGDDDELEIRCRFVFATNRDLDAEVRAGRFRRDLYERIRGLHIEMPPLRERRDDIAMLVAHLLDVLRRDEEATRGDRGPVALPADRNARDVRDALLTRAWEGNIGELAQVVALAFAFESFREALDLSVREADAPALDASPASVWPLDVCTLADLRPVEEVKLAYCRLAAEIAVRMNQREEVARRLGYDKADSFRRRLHDWKIKPPGW